MSFNDSVKNNYFLILPDPDGLIITGTKITNTGKFLWNGSSKIQFFPNMVPFLMEAVETSKVAEVAEVNEAAEVSKA